jgi:hypothetical protein
MRTVRIVASTLAVAALGVVGSQSGALASQATETCTHGIAYDNSSHKRVEYLGSRTTVRPAHPQLPAHHMDRHRQPHPGRQLRPLGRPDGRA